MLFIYKKSLIILLAYSSFIPLQAVGESFRQGVLSERDAVYIGVNEERESMAQRSIKNSPTAWLFAAEVKKSQPDKVDEKQEPSQEAMPLRVGGVYSVEGIDKINDIAFRVTFRNVVQSGKFDVLYLESDHVHFAVKVGQKLRLTAEILSVKGNSAEVNQILLFLPHEQGPVPIWLLSNKNRDFDSKNTRYLEQHAPIFDYLIL